MNSSHGRNAEVASQREHGLGGLQPVEGGTRTRKQTQTLDPFHEGLTSQRLAPEVVPLADPKHQEGTDSPDSCVKTQSFCGPSGGPCKGASLRRDAQRRTRGKLQPSEARRGRLLCSHGLPASTQSDTPRGPGWEHSACHLPIHGLPLSRSFPFFSARNTILSDGCTLGPTHKSLTIL